MQRTGITDRRAELGVPRGAPLRRAGCRVFPRQRSYAVLSAVALRPHGWIFSAGPETGRMRIYEIGTAQVSASNTTLRCGQRGRGFGQ